MTNSFSYEAFNALVRQAGAEREDTYLNAPLYYALTGRKGMWVYQGYGALMVVCQHPHAENRLLVFPEIGDAGGKLAASVLASLVPPPGGVQLARFGDGDLERLKDALSQKNNNPVDHLELIEERLMDWRHPVHIIDTFRVARLEGNAFCKIRNKCRKMNGIQMLSLSDPSALLSMKAAQKYWEGSMLLRERAGNDDISSYYSMLFSLMEAWPDLFEGFVFFEGNRPVGFTVFDKAHNGTVNLLANLSDSATTGQADYQLVETCRELMKKNVQFLNFGGSESEGLDSFKRKYMPVRSIPLRSAEVVYANQNDPHVRSGPLMPELRMR